jgi:hypothetical protein
LSYTQTGEFANLAGSNGMDEMDGNCRAYPEYYDRVNPLNEYKRAWYLASTPVTHERIVRKKPRSSSNKKSFGNEFSKHIKEDIQRGAIRGGVAAFGLASRYAARSQITGALGVGLRVGGKIGLRVVPVVGATLLVYDLYQFGKWLAE